MNAGGYGPARAKVSFPVVPGLIWQFLTFGNSLDFQTLLEEVYQ